MHPLHTLRRPATPPVVRDTAWPGLRLRRLLLWLVVLAPLAWGVYETARDVGRFID